MYLNITYDSLDPKWTRSGGKVLVISNILYYFVTAKIKKTEECGGNERELFLCEGGNVN